MRPFILWMALSMCLHVSAQKEKPAFTFGKVDKSEFSIKECEFDKKAEAIVLFDNAESYCFFNPNSENNPINTQFERHVRIKILNDKGLGQADIHIPYFSYRNITAVKNLKAQTYNLDAAGNIVVSNLDKKNIYEKKLNKRYSELTFSFPEAKAGSIIEYRYKIDAQDMYALMNWNFQQEIPVLYSKYVVDFPKEFEVAVAQFCSQPVKQSFKTKDNHEIQVFEMENLPGLRDEPYISSEKDYLQRVEPRIVAYNSPIRRYNFEKNWVRVIKDLMEDEDFGVQLKRNISKVKDLDAALTGITSEYQKMQSIYAYVRKNMEWNGYTSIWALDGVKSAWSDKKGTSGEINLILVNLLKEYGLKASPILVSTHDNGYVRTHLANIDQFNKVLAYVTIGDNEYYLDATDKYGYPGLIPQEIMYSEGLVIEKLDTYEWGWRTIWDEKKMHRDVVFLNMGLDEKGSIKGHATLTNYDYSKTSKLAGVESTTAKFSDSYTSVVNGLSIDSFALKNTGRDSLPLIQDIDFTQQVNSSGDYKFFNPNIFTGLEKNPFVADQRYSDILFSILRRTLITDKITVPDDHQFDAIPKNIRMITPDTGMVFSRIVEVQGQTASFRINVDFKKPFYSAEEYDQFREFYKQLFDLLNEQFVIRKKANP